MSRKSPAKAELRPRFRITCGDRIALGPGKVQLLEGVREYGSISRATKELGISYMRAWLLIREMNACFKTPLITAKRGDVRSGGGAQLTQAGASVLALYRRINAKSAGAVRPEWQKLQRLLRG
jgi:molybdate transport system regulatory protein